MTRAFPFTPAPAKRAALPRVGFLGVGWIGRARMNALRESGLADIAAVMDCDAANAEAALAGAPTARACNSCDELFASDLDAVVIATPNALHAPQAVAALERGLPVFCQKPLATTYQDASRIVRAAIDADLLLGVDLSYRHLRGVQMLRDMLSASELGDITAIDLTFHNAYGPDKAWFYDRSCAGGGCLLDLGLHLADLAMLLCAGDVQCNDACLRAQGGCTSPDSVEDFAWVDLRAGGVPVRLACSWNLHAGCDCVIKVEVIGTTGSAVIENVAGSFYDFETRCRRGTAETVLAREDGWWGGEAIRAWARRLATDSGFDLACEHHLHVMRLIEDIYTRGSTCASS